MRVGVEWRGIAADGRETDDMHNEFTAIIQRDGKRYVSWCPEVPGANGQGRTLKACRASLAEAISLILEDRREEALRSAPPAARRVLARKICRGLSVTDM